MLMSLVAAQAMVALNVLVQVVTAQTVINGRAMTQTLMTQEMTALPSLKTPVMVQW